jgi:hypothetical protein
MAFNRQAFSIQVLQERLSSAIFDALHDAFIHEGILSGIQGTQGDQDTPSTTPPGSPKPLPQELEFFSSTPSTTPPGSPIFSLTEPGFISPGGNEFEDHYGELMLDDFSLQQEAELGDTGEQDPLEYGLEVEEQGTTDMWQDQMEDPLEYGLEVEDQETVDMWQDQMEDLSADESTLLNPDPQSKADQITSFSQVHTEPTVSTAPFTSMHRRQQGPPHAQAQLPGQSQSSSSLGCSWINVLRLIACRLTWDPGIRALVIELFICAIGTMAFFHFGASVTGFRVTIL